MDPDNIEEFYTGDTPDKQYQSREKNRQYDSKSVNSNELTYKKYEYGSRMKPSNSAYLNTIDNDYNIKVKKYPDTQRANG